MRPTDTRTLYDVILDTLDSIPKGYDLGDIAELVQEAIVKWLSQ